MSRRGRLPSLSELAATELWMQREAHEVLQESKPKPWIVDVATQRRPKHATNHRRVK